MPLTKLQFRPGIVQDLTSYANEGGWRDGDKTSYPPRGATAFESSDADQR